MVGPIRLFEGPNGLPLVIRLPGLPAQEKAEGQDPHHQPPQADRQPSPLLRLLAHRLSPLRSGSARETGSPLLCRTTPFTLLAPACISSRLFPPHPNPGETRRRSREPSRGDAPTDRSRDPPGETVFFVSASRRTPGIDDEPTDGRRPRGPGPLPREVSRGPRPGGRTTLPGPSPGRSTPGRPRPDRPPRRRGVRGPTRAPLR